MPWYDEYGWLTSVEDPQRFTPQEPPVVIPSGHAANWNGYIWRVLPYAKPEAAVYRRITRLAFRNRFTALEKAKIELAAIDDKLTLQSQRMQAASLRVYLQDIQSSTYIDLDRSDTQAGVRALETFGLLEAGRADTILLAAITQEEIWR